MSKNLELNQGDNFIFGIDVSGSMGSTDCPGGMSRIDYLKGKVIDFAGEASKYDEDGIDVLTFGHKITEYLGVTGEKAAEIIGALGATEISTDTAALIKAAYKLHKDAKKEQTVLFIATDGEPNNRGAVKTAITEIANDVKDEREFCIFFLTVGNIDDSLRSFLTALDDDLKDAKYDIVDVKSLEEVDFFTAFAGAIND